MAMRLTMIAAAFAVTSTAGAAKEAVRVPPPQEPIEVASAMTQNQVMAAENIQIEVSGGGVVLWSGSLRMGGTYGSASYSQSKNEFADGCAANPENSNRSVSQNLNVGISRQDWQRKPDSFNVTFNWTRPMRGCNDQGTDTLGMNRLVIVPRGQRVRVEGEAGIVITITRPRP